MYAARAAGAALRPLLHEHDVGSADAFEEKGAGPAHLADERISLDLQFVHVLLRASVLVNDTEQNLVAIERICPGRRLGWIAMAIDGLIERHREMTILGQIQASGELPRFVKHRTVSRIDVSARHRRRDRLGVARAPATREGGDSRSEEHTSE